MRGRVNAQANKSTDVGVIGSKKETESAGDGRQHEQRTNDSAVVLWHAIVEKRTGRDPNHNEGALGNTQQSRVELVVSETLDDQSAELLISC